MPLEAPVTIATLLDSLLIFTIVLDPTLGTPDLLGCELHLARMKISIYDESASSQNVTADRSEQDGFAPWRMIAATPS
jgi:hypothetical protein